MFHYSKDKEKNFVDKKVYFFYKEQEKVSYNTMEFENQKRQGRKKMGTKDGYVLLLEDVGRYYHKIMARENITDAHFFDKKQDALDKKEILEQYFKEKVKLIPVTKSVSESNGWNEEEIMKQMDDYLENTPDEQKIKDFEEAGGILLDVEELVVLGETEGNSTQFVYDPIHEEFLVTLRDEVGNWTTRTVKRDGMEEIIDLFRRGLRQSEKIGPKFVTVICKDGVPEAVFLDPKEASKKKNELTVREYRKAAMLRIPGYHYELVSIPFIKGEIKPTKVTRSISVLCKDGKPIEVYQDWKEAEVEKAKEESYSIKRLPFLK